MERSGEPASYCSPPAGELLTGGTGGERAADSWPDQLASDPARL